MNNLLRYLFISLAFLCFHFVVPETYASEVPYIGCSIEETSALDKSYFGVVQEKTPLCVAITPAEANDILHMNIMPENAQLFKNEEELDLPASVTLQSSNVKQIVCFDVVFHNVVEYSIAFDLQCGADKIVSNFKIIVVDFIRKGNLRAWQVSPNVSSTYQLETVKFFAKVNNVSLQAAFYWDFGDGSTQISKEGLAKTSASHKYRTFGSFNVTIVALYETRHHQVIESVSFLIDILPAFHLEIPEVASIHKEVNLNILSNISSSSKCEYLWKFSDNTTFRGRNLACVKKTFDVPGIHHVNVSIDVDSDRVVLLGSTGVEEPIISVTVTIDPNYLPVVNTWTNFIASVVPEGSILNYTWSSLNSAYPAQSENSKKFLILTDERVTAIASNSINSKSGVLNVTSLTPFHQYTASWESSSQYAAGNPVKLTINSVGLDIIHYNVTQNGLVIKDEERKYPNNVMYLTFNKGGLYNMQIEAYIPGKQGFVARYVQDTTITPFIQKRLTIKSVITTLFMKVSESATAQFKLPAKQMVKLDFLTDGFGSIFYLSINSMDQQLHPIWNETLQLLVASFNYFATSSGNCKLVLFADNTISYKGLIQYIEFQEVLSSFDIQKSAFYHKVDDPVLFTLSAHQGSHVRYIWDFKDGSYFTKTNSMPIEHIYDKTGIFNVSVKAENSVSNYEAFTEVHVFKDLSEFKWGSTRSRRSLETHEVFPINLTFNSGLPVHLIVDLGNGEVINATIQPHIYSVFYHSYKKPGFYHVTATAASAVGTKMQISHQVNVQERIKEIHVKWSSNSTVFCIPSTIELHGIVRTGSNVTCKITSGIQTLFHDAALHKPEKQHLACNTTYNLTTIGYYNFTIKMYNNVNEKSAIINSIKGKQPMPGRFTVNVTTENARVGTDSFVRVHGDFDCPLLKCDLNFGDENIAFLQHVVNGSVFSHRYSDVGQYNISGVCFSHYHQETMTTKALVIDPLVVNEVVYKDDCFPVGETYVVEAKFKHASLKQWQIKINGSQVANSSDLVSDTGLNATVRIKPDFYGDYGDKQLQISVSDAVGKRNILQTNLCIRRITEKVYLSVVPAAAPGWSIKFNLHLTDASVTGSSYLSFGDGDVRPNTVLTYPITTILKTYSGTASYTYTWRATNSVIIAQGTGVMEILHPIGNKYNYFFPTLTELDWPNNYFEFYFGVRCYASAPTSTEYRIHFGDGEISPWLGLPWFNCFSTATLVGHTYKEPDCFQTYMEIRNLLSREEYSGELNVRLAIASMQLTLDNVPPIQATERVRPDMTEVYLRDSYPIEIVANTTGGKCLTFVWSIPSISWSKNTGRTNKVELSDLVGRSGSFVIEVTVTNKVNSVMQKKRIVLIKAIVGLQLLNSEPAAGGAVDFFLLLENNGTNATFNWDFGDGNYLNVSNVNFKPALEIPNILSIKGTGTLRLENHVAAVQSYRYTKDGLFRAEVRAKDNFTTAVAKRDVYLSSDKLCKRPTVKVLHKDDKVMRFSFAGSFTVLADVQIDCEDSNKVDFKWHLYQGSKIMMENNRHAVPDMLISFPAGVVTDQRDLRIDRRTILPGIYIIRLLVEMKGLGFSESDEAYMEVTREPLYAEISGTTTRLLAWEKDIFLDARNSKDPNFGSANTGSLRYKWYCRVKPGSLAFTIGKGGCFGYGEWVVEHESSTWTIPAKKLVQNVVYIIRLRVESLSISGAFAEVEQFIDVRSGTVISTSIECKANCRRNIDPKSRLSLIGKCLQCGKYVTYKWELLRKDNFAKVPVGWMVDTLTSQDSVSFVLLPFWLTKATEYLARITVTTAWGEVGYADHGFKVSTPPQGGFCNVTPSDGEAIKTKFGISCYDWHGSTQTLQYSILLVANQQQSNEVKSTASTVLISYGASSSTEATLQEGLLELNYTQQLLIRISDSYGATAETNLTTRVRPFTIKKEEEQPDKPSENTVENKLETYVIGKTSRLSTLVGTGNVQELGRFTKAIGKSLDSAKKESTSIEVADAEKEKRKEKRKNIRTTIVNSLTDVKLTNLDNFAVISSALKDVSSSEDEINEGSQDKMLHFFEDASKFLEGSYSTWGERDPKEIQDAFQGFLEGVGNVIESATTTTKSGSIETDRSTEQYKKFTDNSLKVIENTTSLLFRSLVIEEAARRINGESLSIEIKRSQADRLNSRMVKTLGGGQLQTPSGRSFLGQNNTNITSVDTKMVTLLRNPHIVDKENIGKSLTPTISSLKFLSGDEEISVKNLSKGDDIIIEVPNPNVKMTNKSASLKKGEMRFLLLRLPLKDIKLLLKIRCFGAPCDIFVSHEGLPSANNYSEMFTIKDSVQPSNESEYRIYNVLNSTKFNIGILYNESSILTTTNNNSTEVRFDLKAFVTGCFYWEEAMSKWSSEGCEVSNRTTVSNTICLCNHLTWFGGGFIVQPNALDIAVEVMKIKDIADYPALLATLCTIVGCYLIALIWARRQDKLDALKTTLIIPEDCCQSHKFRYDVTITSGSRPGSGTSASVCMILGGSLGESHPFCLSHNSEIFQRGSIDSFLITAEHDLGEIQFIRLWHDNTGESPAWFVSRISVTNILSGTQNQFLCNTWLALGVGDGKIDNVFVAAEEKELKCFETIFLAKTSRGFSDEHLWFSVTMRPPRSHFTRVQRISCCLCTLLCTMLANAMFYRRNTVVVGTSINVGSFSFNWNQIIIGVQSAVIVIPINLLIVTLFRKAAPSVKKLVEAKHVSETDVAISATSPSNVESAMDSEVRKDQESTINMPDADNSRKSILVSECDVAGKSPPGYPFMNIVSKDTLDLISTLNHSDNNQTSLDGPVDEVLKAETFENAVETDHDEDDIFPDVVNSDEIQLISSQDIILDIDDEDPDETNFSGILLSKDTLELIFHLNKNSDIVSSEDQIAKLDLSSASVKLTETKTLDELENSSSYMKELPEKASSIIGADESKKKKNGETFWPHWCQVFAWLLCFLATVTAGFFTLLYGLSFGRTVQEEWLVSFFTSVFQDIFISQPGKVLVIGCFFALIIKKLAEENVLPEVHLAKDEEWVQRNLPLQEKGATSSKINIPLTPSYIKKAHAERLKEIKMTDLSLEIIAYFFYIFLALLIAYGHRAPNAYDMTDNLNKMIITDKFDKITNSKDFWQWTNSTFLPEIYGEVWYNGDPTEHKGFLSDYVTYLLGSPRFRQLRVVEDLCPVSGDIYNINRTFCGGEYSSSSEDDGDYDVRWTNRSYSGQSAGITEEDPWKYHSQLELRGHPFLADLQTYSGSGYIISIGKSLAQANTSVNYLKENLWIDSLTRAIFVEFTTYNNNNNFYCIVTLLLEFTPDGGAFPFTRIVTTRLDRYNSDFSFFLAACEISFLLLTLYYMWLEIKRFRRKATLYFQSWGSFVEVLLLSLTWATFALFIVRYGVVKWTKKKYQENPAKFTSFQYAASSDLAYGYTLACLIFVAFLKVLKILRFNKNMLLLYKTLQYATGDLKYYGILFSIPCFGYIQWAYLAFGSQLVDYATYLRAFLSIVNLLLGSGEFEDLEAANRVIGPIFYIIFVVTMCFILMNMFLSIVMQAFAEVRRAMANQKNKYEIIEFIYEKIMNLLPCQAGLMRNGLDTVHSKCKIDDYYQKRVQCRRGTSFESPKEISIEAVINKLDRVEDVVNKCLLYEYEDLEQLSQFALRLRRRLRKEKEDALE